MFMLRKRTQNETNSNQWTQIPESPKKTRGTHYRSLTSSERKMDIEYDRASRPQWESQCEEASADDWEERVAGCRYVLHPLYNDQSLVSREDRRAFTRLCTEILRELKALAVDPDLREQIYTGLARPQSMKMISN